MGLITEPSKKDVLEGMWRRAKLSYIQKTSDRSLVGPDDVLPFEDVSRAKIDSVLKRIKLYQPHDSHPTGIYKVRLAKLVTPQININLKRAEGRVDVKAGMTQAELFSVAFESKPHPQPIHKQIIGRTPDNGAFLFTSYDEDLRAHQPLYRKIPVNEKDDVGPVFDGACFPIGGGLELINAFRVRIGSEATRIILMNGIHRIYRLIATNHEWCPMILTDFDISEVGDPIVELSKELVLNPKLNPPLVADFADSKLALTLTYFSALVTVRLNWSVERYSTVVKPS